MVHVLVSVLHVARCSGDVGLISNLTNFQIPPFPHLEREFANIYMIQKSKFNLAVDEKIQVSRKLLEEFLREFF
jgi:hypothetical protein